MHLTDMLAATEVTFVNLSFKWRLLFVEKNTRPWETRCLYKWENLYWFQEGQYFSNSVHEITLSIRFSFALKRCSSPLPCTLCSTSKWGTCLLTEIIHMLFLMSFLGVFVKSVILPGMWSGAGFVSACVKCYEAFYNAFVQVLLH